MSWFSAAILWLHQWQTLAAGLIAIAAALIGARAINRQIQQSDEHEQKRIKRKLTAARVVFPLTLSALCEYSEECARYLIKVYSFRKGDVVQPTASRLPERPILPDEILTGLTVMAEAANDHVAGWINKLAANLQIQYARMRSMHSGFFTDYRIGRITTAENIEQYVIDAAKIYASASALFDFARAKTEAAPQPLTWDNISSALDCIGADFEIGEQISAIIASRKERGITP